MKCIYIALIFLFILAPVAWAQSFSLGTTNLVEGFTSGSDGVVLAANGAWTATTNAAWLHLSAANQSGVGSTNVIFTFDANPGATRTGTLTIAGQTLTVTQAGSTYVAAITQTPNTLVSSGLNTPYGLAVDGAGNVYIADSGNNAIKEWVALSNTVTTLVSSGLNTPDGVAVDAAGNVYIADTGNNAIKEWIAASNAVTTLVSAGLSQPRGVAVDGAGNVYIADSGNNALKEWVIMSNTVSTLVPSGLNVPFGVALDGAGNVYIATTASGIRKWIAASHTVTTLRILGFSLTNPNSVAVDGAGNVYSASAFSIMKWLAASNTVITLMTSGVSVPKSVAVDGAGNVYIVETNNGAIKELSPAYVDPTTKVEPASAGSDALPVVFPVTSNLTGPSAPVSDSAWLTITGVSNGVVTFAFSANTLADRTAHIQLLGQNITVIQMVPTNYFSLGATNLVEGSPAGSDSVMLSANGAWTAVANAGWLHLSASNLSGAISTNVLFTFDANPGVTRTGTLTIAGQTLTITQAGSTYVAANAVPLVSSGFAGPISVAVDGTGNVYIADANTIKEWVAASNTVITLVSSGLITPYGVAVDGAGNVYIADNGNEAIKEWVAASNTVTTLVSSGLFNPWGVAVDSFGNVYIADTASVSIKKWMVVNNSVFTLTSAGFDTHASAVAVDGAGNVYIPGPGNIKKWVAASNIFTTLVSSNIFSSALVVDEAGNVYMLDDASSSIEKWTAANSTVTTLLPSGLFNPWGVAVDGAGNVYTADLSGNALYELLPHAFVDPTPKTETPFAVSDALPVVLPATANLTGPFAPLSDSTWLTITGVTNGVVSFAFTATATNRTAHITLLGRSIAVTQQAVTPPILTGYTILNNGAFQFGFTNNQGVSFTIWTTTNLLLPLANWTVLGTLTNDGSGQYQFTDVPATNMGQQFYRVSSP